MKKYLVCHYGEVGLKGKNRRFFEEQLVANIKETLPGAEVSSPRGMIVVSKTGKAAQEKIEKIPGIAYFFSAEAVLPSLEEIRRKVVSLAKKKKFNTFRVTVKRGDKSFSPASNEVAADLGEAIRKKTGKKVDLSLPEITFFIEIAKERAFVYFEKIKGIGGLPVGTGGKAVSLLSGGIDSPVASFRMIKRGVKNIFVHFHAYPATSKQSIEKVKRIAKILSSFQGKTVLYLVPFNRIQKEIVLSTQEKTRVLLYRRFMVRIASEIAKKEKAEAIITGESLGQVASQTAKNMAVTENTAGVPVFRPLIGYDKEEIIKEAKDLKTYEISILPEEDCCIRFVPASPETGGSILQAEREEEKIKKEHLVEEAIKETERKIV